MALSKSITLNLKYETSIDSVSLGVEKEIVSNVEIPSAYIKITNIEGNKNSIFIDIEIFNNNECNTLLEIKRYYFKPSVEDTASNFIKQGYEYLKTLDEYKDAVDVLDEGQTI